MRVVREDSQVSFDWARSKVPTTSVLVKWEFGRALYAASAGVAYRLVLRDGWMEGVEGEKRL